MALALFSRMVILALRKRLLHSAISLIISITYAGQASATSSPASDQDLVTRHVQIYQKNPGSTPPMSRGFLHSPTRVLPSELDIGAVYHPYIPQSLAEKQSHPLLDPAVQEQISATTQSDLTYGNKLSVVTNGETFQEKLRMLDRTKHFFVSTTMLFNCDASVEPFVQKMLTRQREGIAIYLIVDRFFSSAGFDECLQRLMKGGVNVLYNEASTPIVHRRFFHDKFTVRDGVEGLVEGPNVVDIQSDADGFNGLYRDTGVVITGPAVTDLLSEAQRLWRYLAPSKLNQKNGVPSELPFASVVAEQTAKELLAASREIGGRVTQSARLKNLDGACRVVFQGPHREPDLVSRAYEAYLSRASSYIAVPSQRKNFAGFESGDESAKWKDRLVDLVLERSRNGVRVDFFMNFHNTPFTVVPPNTRPTPPITRLMKVWDTLTLSRRQKGALTLFNEEGGPGLEVWSYFQYYHSKHVIIDQVAGGVGSFNLDNLSSEKNHEMVLLCNDSSLIEQLQRMTALDMLNSVPMLSKSR